MEGRMLYRPRPLNVAIVLGLLLSVPAALAGNGNGKGRPHVISPNVRIQGLSYAEWSAAWWQWGFSIPVHDADGGIMHPLFDETGDRAAVGQRGNVWFLGGVFNASGKVTRDITVPCDTYLFIPVINVECSTLEGNGETEAELRQCAGSIMDHTSGLTATIDGVPVRRLERYRVQSPLFEYFVPGDNFLGAPSGSTSPAVSDGVFLMLAPLSAGAHTIHFGGTFDDFGFTLDITYHITVVTGDRCR